MTLDEGHHRLFVGCRIPASLLVFDTESGKMVVSLTAVGSDDIFYDASKGRVYVLGNPTQTDARQVGAGFTEVFQQKDADHYANIATYPTGSGAWIGLFVPEWGKLFVATRRQGETSGGILVYETN
jgi:hypothetical protein